MTEELTYILSLLSEQERDVIKAIIAERDTLKAEVARWNAIETERGDLLYRTLGHRDLVNFIARFKELTDDLATVTAERDELSVRANKLVNKNYQEEKYLAKIVSRACQDLDCQPLEIYEKIDRIKTEYKKVCEYNERLSEINRKLEQKP